MVGHASIIAYGYKQALGALPSEKKDEKKNKTKWVYRPDDWVRSLSPFTAQATVDNGRPIHVLTPRTSSRPAARPLGSFRFRWARHVLPRRSQMSFGGRVEMRPM